MTNAGALTANLFFTNWLAGYALRTNPLTGQHTKRPHIHRAGPR
ncbi:MAG: hypothetical protein ACXWPS_16815 [Ktedonobacteraceae bacterium]